jgi:hypothetical protein
LRIAESSPLQVGQVAAHESTGTVAIKDGELRGFGKVKYLDVESASMVDEQH